MRFITFFISIYFFVLGYGNDFAFAAKKIPSTHSIAYTFQKNPTQQYKTKEHNNVTVFEYTDIELEEDYHSNDEPSDFHSSFLFQNSYIYNWNSFFSILFQSEYQQNGSITVIATNLFSIPMYLKNRVLRI